MQSYHIANRKVTDLTMIVTVGGAPTSKDVVSSYRPFSAFVEQNNAGQWYPINLRDLALPTVSDKKLDGILYRQTGPKKFKEDIAYFEPTFPPKKLRNKNQQAFCQKSTQFILRNIGPEISYSTAKEVLGQPTRKGKFLIWPEASFEQEVVMAAIDQCHDRCNGAIYNGVITIGNQEIKIKDHLRRAE